MAYWKGRSTRNYYNHSYSNENNNHSYDHTQQYVEEDLDQYKPIHITPELKPDPREMVEEDLNIAPEWACNDIDTKIINTDFKFGAIINRFNRKQNRIRRRKKQYKSDQNKENYTQYNHPHYKLSIKELQNINLRQKNVCYIKGLPIHIAKKHILRQNEWFGSFGKIIRIIFPQHDQDKLFYSQTVSITFDSNISALNAINYCMNNNFVFNNPNRKIKAIYGMQQYCISFLKNIECVQPNCGLRHSWCEMGDIITKYDINKFKAISFGVRNNPLTNAKSKSLQRKRKYNNKSKYYYNQKNKNRSSQTYDNNYTYYNNEYYDRNDSYY